MPWIEASITSIMCSTGTFFPARFKPAAKLHQAPGIRRYQHIWQGGEAVLHFLVAQFGCRIQLYQVVNSGRTATDGGVRDLQNFQLRNHRQHLARLEAHALRVLQMAGIVVGDNLISNIHARGVSPSEAANRILDLANQMMRAQLSGTELRVEPERLA